ncbi:hypothetical protein AB0H49_23025, partial [Nocardia sp. NPDC050713]|uniref:hypothetical protein n=1 Tax=Nocardia sp. NPDC050713 TaxID=3154511 RepID=UPI0033CF3071
AELPRRWAAPGWWRWPLGLSCAEERRSTGSGCAADLRRRRAAGLVELPGRGAFELLGRCAAAPLRRCAAAPLRRCAAAPLRR